MTLLAPLDFIAIVDLAALGATYATSVARPRYSWLSRCIRRVGKIEDPLASTLCRMPIHTTMCAPSPSLRYLVRYAERPGNP